MQTASTHRGSFIAASLQPLQATLAGRLLLVVSASLFVAACAHISVHIPFTPVPFTLADFAVLLVGLTLGSALGPAAAFSALALYLAEGASGLPVFAPGGLGGIAQLLGPTGGYLIAYPLAAALAAALNRRLANLHTSRFAAALIAAFAASTLLMTTGVIWLGFIHHLAPALAFRLGALPFLPGQLVKIVSAAGIFTTLARWRQLSSRQPDPRHPPKKDRTSA